MLRATLPAIDQEPIRYDLHTSSSSRYGGYAMDSEQHKAIVRRFFDEVWNQQKLEVIEEIFASTIIFNGHPIERTALQQIIASRRAAFPDIHVTVDDQIAEGDKVSTRRTWRATHQGTYRGIAPTGKHVKWTQIGMV